MITSPAWSGKRYAVLGLARSGAATVEALLASGAEVVAWDENEEARAKFLPGTGRGTSEAGGGGFRRSPKSDGGRGEPPPPPAEEAGGPPPRTGEDLKFADPLTLDLATFDAVVVSPGIPLNRHPISAAARAADVPIIGDIELFAQARASLPPHKVVGITGTNGKSTTTALVHHILREAGVPTTMGGNIGLPILAQEPLAPNEHGVGVYVLELSSYQIDLTHSLDCDVAVLLNITPDHLDRYASFEAYRASKLRLFTMQNVGTGYAVIPEDDRSLWRYLLKKIEQVNLIFISATDFENGRIQEFSPAESPRLQGPHNLINASAAVLTAHTLRLEPQIVRNALRTFPGLPHRMERIADRSGVLFVNDSKATNPASAAPALAAFEAVHWILGGQAKSDDLEACVPHFGHVRAAYTIGEAGASFARILKNHMPVADCGTLHAAVRSAAAAARPGEVVLLSPACASFDQFRDFEARGDAFRAAVEALE